MHAARPDDTVVQIDCHGWSTACERGGGTRAITRSIAPTTSRSGGRMVAGTGLIVAAGRASETG